MGQCSFEEKFERDTHDGKKVWKKIFVVKGVDGLEGAYHRAMNPVFLAMLYV